MTCMRCHGPDNGTPLCGPCEEAVEREQLYADIHEDGRPPALSEAEARWLAVQLAAAHDDPRGIGDGLGR